MFGLKAVILYFVCLMPPMHDVPIAFFNLDITENQILLNIKVDRADTQKTIEEYSKGAFSKRKLQDYLIEHFLISVNQELQQISFTSFKVDEEHFIIDGVIVLPSTDIEGFLIENNCLVEHIRNHSNIINISEGDNQDTYRMTKSRSKKQIKF